MLVLQENMEYEFYINAPVAGQSLASLPVNQVVNDNQEEIDPGNNNVVDDNGEFDQFSLLFLEFSSEILIFHVDFDFASDFLTLFLTESIGKICSNEADSAIDR